MNAGVILLVEDNPNDELLTLRALGRTKLTNRIDVVRDGQQALDYLFATGEFSDQQGSALPIVVLLDISLPRLSGLEVLARLRANTLTALLPVVMFTSSDDERDRLRSYESRCNSFVRKPIDFGAFAETVTHMGTYWATINRGP